MLALGDSLVIQTGHMPSAAPTARRLRGEKHQASTVGYAVGKLRPGCFTGEDGGRGVAGGQRYHRVLTGGGQKVPHFCSGLNESGNSCERLYVT